MNIAFPAIFLFLLLLPGFVFHHFCQNREIRASYLPPFSAAVFVVVMAALVINFLVMAVARWLGHYEFHLGEIVRFLAGGASGSPDVVLTRVYQRLDADPFEPLYFFFATNALAGAVAGLWRLTVWRFRLDHPSFRFHKRIRPPAPWYYLFNGIDAPYESIDGVVVSAIVPMKDGAYLYTGLLSAYYLTDKGELDRLVVSSAARRRLEDDRSPGETVLFPLYDLTRFYQIEGDYFVLRASEWVTLNVKFLVLEDAQADQGSDAGMPPDTPQGS